MSGFERRALATQALNAAASSRRKAGLPDLDPISPIDAAGKLGVTVRFVGISMEGMYRHGSRPDIILSSLRPATRKAFTCAHELGHNAFGHGSTIDELRDEGADALPSSPEEFLADAFAGHFLMPPVALRGALARRGLDPRTSSATDLYPIACAFGVALDSLVTQLSSGLNLITYQRALELRRFRPAQVRRAFLKADSNRPLYVLDEKCEASTVDVEVGSDLLLPPDFESEGCCLRHSRVDGGRGFVSAVCPGIGRISSPSRGWSAFVRVMKHEYVGLAKYRHLEDLDE